jgi:trk system potassium uptake protein TrkA
VEGNATSAEILREAGAEKADLLLAATEQDEVNMVCGISARKLGTRHVIARVRDPEYLSQREFLREALGLSVIVNPEYECAKEISRILRFPSAVRVDAFSKGSAEIVEHRVREGGKLDGIQLRMRPQQLGARVLVGVVERGGEAIIPNGDFILRGGDRLSITGSSSELRRFFIACGSYQRPVRRAMLMGGGRIAVYLSRLLLEAGVDVTVVERDRERCDRLLDLIPKAHIVCGDATRSDVLLEDGLSSADAFVALTGEDGDNIITSLYARDRGVPKIVAKVNREHFSDILENSGLDSIVTPKDLVAQQLARYVRAMNNSLDSSMETLYRLADGQIEALEFKIGSGSALVGVPLKDLKLKPSILISAVIRGTRSIIPDGQTVIQPGDHAVIVAGAGRIQNVDEILEENA